jgi:hypothetical protein
MKAASSTPTPHCARCHTPLDDPNLQASSAPLTLEALEQLFLKFIQATPTLPDSAEVAESVKLDAPGDDQPKPEIVRAMVNEVYVSNTESKWLNLLRHSWNTKEHKYKIVDSVTPKEELDNIGLDKKTGDPKFHIDIKSEHLQEILTKVLQGVKVLCFAGEKPIVLIHMKLDKLDIAANLCTDWAESLYNYLPELEVYRSTIDGDDENVVAQWNRIHWID